MAQRDWDILIWHRANDLLQKAERIHRNFLQIAAGANYHASQGRTPSWEPPINVIETDETLWVVSALPGVSADQVEVKIDGNELVIAGHRPLPECCKDGELKIWEIPLGRFERRLRVVRREGPLLLSKVSLQEGLLIIQLRKHS
ncbi:MAG: Hsp20 family protein [Deltaproteobacteria bacterium]|nr:Hsp20 family protein [Deltaproteobacteria bacterium]